jgi:hypothetical protein
MHHDSFLSSNARTISFKDCCKLLGRIHDTSVRGKFTHLVSSSPGSFYPVSRRIVFNVEHGNSSSLFDGLNLTNMKEIIPFSGLEPHVFDGFILFYTDTFIDSRAYCTMEVTWSDGSNNITTWVESYFNLVNADYHLSVDMTKRMENFNNFIQTLCADHSRNIINTSKWSNIQSTMKPVSVTIKLIHEDI